MRTKSNYMRVSQHPQMAVNWLITRPVRQQQSTWMKKSLVNRQMCYYYFCYYYYYQWHHRHYHHYMRNKCMLGTSVHVGAKGQFCGVCSPLQCLFGLLGLCGKCFIHWARTQAGTVIRALHMQNQSEQPRKNGVSGTVECRLPGAEVKRSPLETSVQAQGCSPSPQCWEVCKIS